MNELFYFASSNVLRRFIYQVVKYVSLHINSIMIVESIETEPFSSAAGLNMHDLYGQAILGIVIWRKMVRRVGDRTM